MRLPCLSAQAFPKTYAKETQAIPFPVPTPFPFSLTPSQFSPFFFVFAHPRRAPSPARFFACLSDLRLEKKRKQLLRRLSSLWIHSAIVSWIHSYFDNAMTNFMINNRTDAWKIKLSKSTSTS